MLTTADQASQNESVSKVDVTTEQDERAFRVSPGSPVLRYFSVPDERDQQTNPAEIYLKEGPDPMFGEPALAIAGRVSEVLFVQGIFTRLIKRLALSFDQYEGEIVPVEKLENLAAACREYAADYVDPDADYEASFHTVTRQTGDSVHHSQFVISASGGELQQALLDLADLADEARRRGVPILAST